MLDILYDIHQNRKISQADAKASASMNTAERIGDRLDDLEERVDRMALLNMALWTLMKKKGLFTEDDLAMQVQALDLQDGKLDGRMASAPIECNDCGKTLHQRHRRCLYCGFELKKSGFEAVVR